MIQIKVEVKFRAFGITFGTVRETYKIPSPVPIPPGLLASVDERGVKVEVRVL